MKALLIGGNPKGLLRTDRKHVDAKRALIRKLGRKAADNRAQTELTGLLE